MKSEQSIREFLSMIGERDLQGLYIAPKKNVQPRLEKEVQQKTGCTPSQLTSDAKELDKMRVSTEPQQFVGETANAIEKICTILKQQRAKKFEIHFVNPDRDPQCWGDQIVFGTRYLA